MKCAIFYLTLGLPDNPVKATPSDPKDPRFDPRKCPITTSNGTTVYIRAEEIETDVRDYGLSLAKPEPDEWVMNTHPLERDKS